MSPAVKYGAIAVCVLFVLAASPLAAAAVAAALTLARAWRWPATRIPSYFRGRRLALPALAFAFGASLTIVRHQLPISTEGAAVAAIAAAVALGTLILIYEEKIMSDTFSLVPEGRQAWLGDKLDQLDAGRGADGQAADFSGLDADGVTRQIQARVIGQDSTVAEVVHVAFRRARLQREHKPVGVFLFVGATGVGKTELGKALAHELFADRLLRVDCNELNIENATWRLVGPPPGHVGADQGSQFCRELGRLGSGVLLLDEIEKAHPAVLKTLMGLLDEGRITEQSTSTTYSARGFIVVMTSNAAAREIGQVAAVEGDPAMREKKVRDALRDTGFLPEILGRLDGVFLFRPLSSRDVARVVEVMLRRAGAEAGVEVVSADAELLLGLVTQHAKVSDYGIRELSRMVASAVMDQLLDAHDRGLDRVAIRVRGVHVSVEAASTEAAAQEVS